jgi:TorA maturation chaperone TorD
MQAESVNIASAVTFESPRLISAEDQARADFYALLASLFYRAPDDRLLQSIVIASDPADDEKSEASEDLLAAWHALAEASNVVSHDAVADEYEAVFVGVGRPPVMLYGSFYMAGFMMEKPLAELRTDLAKLGFTRDAAARESEDHLAAVCDVMRALILGDLSVAPASTAEQKKFFMQHMQPWVLKCCSAVNDFEQSNYYRRVARFAAAFFEIEIAAFEID